MQRASRSPHRRGYARGDHTDGRRLDGVAWGVVAGASGPYSFGAAGAPVRPDAGFTAAAALVLAAAVFVATAALACAAAGGTVAATGC